MMGEPRSIEARIAVIEAGESEAKDQRNRMISTLERVDKTLIEVVSGNNHMIERMTNGHERMNKHEARLDAIERENIKRDTRIATERRTAWRAWGIASAFGAACVEIAVRGAEMLQAFLAGR